MTKHNRFPPEVRQRAIRMVLENQNTYNSQWAAICSIAPKIGCTPETLRIWIRQQEPVDDEQNALTASERQRLKELERKSASCAAAMIFCVRLQRILPRRSSTATGKNNAASGKSER